MSIERPYRRLCRPFSNAAHGLPERSGYILDPRFAKNSRVYVETARLLLKELENVFEFVEPDSRNLKTHSYKIHSLFLRVCVEVEANFRAILIENEYKPSGNLGMNDYRKVDHSHKLSRYIIRFHHWHDRDFDFRPFSKWRRDILAGLEWWKAYNQVKHDRAQNFEIANFENLMLAYSALAALIHSQFGREDFSRFDYLTIGKEKNLDGFEHILDDRIDVRKTPHLSKLELYSFDWKQIKDLEDAFQCWTY